MTAGVIKLNRDDHILVLEDPTQVRRSVEQELVAKGYTEVEAASTEDGAVALARRRPPRVLILNEPPGLDREAALRFADAGGRIRERAGLKGVTVLTLGLGASE